MKSITRSKSQNVNLASLIAGTIVAAGSLLGQPLWANSSGPTISAHATKDVQALDLVLGKSTVVDVPVAIKRASLANPAIADAMVLSPKQIYVTGKGFGSTNLTLWGKDDQILAIFDEKVINLLKIYPELPSEAKVNDRDQVTVEVIRGTAVNSVKF
jgi:Flp pilus assembly secretin CpaC